MGPIPTAEPEVKKMYILFVKRMGRVKTSHDNVRILEKQETGDDKCETNSRGWCNEAN